MMLDQIWWIMLGFCAGVAFGGWYLAVLLKQLVQSGHLQIHQKEDGKKGNGQEKKGKE